jgi:hypothetical protein
MKNAVFGMLRCVAFVRTDISEEPIVSTRVKRIGPPIIFTLLREAMCLRNVGSYMNIPENGILH